MAMGWLSNAFDKVYPADGYGMGGSFFRYWPRSHTINGREVDLGNYEYFTNSLLIRLTSFFGIANRMRHYRDRAPSFINIVKNFFLIPEDDAPRWQKVLQWLAVITLIPFAFNLLSMIGSTLIHTVMLVTELAPLALSNYLHEIGAPFPLSELAYALYFISRAITSPIASMRDAITGRPPLGAIVLGSLSATISILAFMFLFPLAIKFIAINILPTAAAWVGQTLAAFISSSPALQAIAQGLFVLGANIGAAIAVSPFIVGLSAAIGLVTTIPGIYINEGINYLLNKIFNNSTYVPIHHLNPDFFDDLPTLEGEFGGGPRGPQPGFGHRDMNNRFAAQPLPQHQHGGGHTGIMVQQPVAAARSAAVAGSSASASYPGAGPMYVQPAPLLQQPADGPFLQPVFIAKQ